jgi:hypothetical protein
MDTIGRVYAGIDAEQVRNLVQNKNKRILKPAFPVEQTPDEWGRSATSFTQLTLNLSKGVHSRSCQSTGCYNFARQWVARAAAKALQTLRTKP